MKKSNILSAMFSLLSGILLLQGCATTTPPFDYGAYMQHMPASILVFPPCNESAEVMAPYIYLSTVTRPLAERGYYVFPVAVIDKLMKENGISSPDEMAQVPIDKINEIIDPDAILYITIKQWGTKYQILNSTIVVHVEGQLVHADTGTVLWQGGQKAVRNSSNGQNGIIEMLIAALINQIVSTYIDPSREIAQTANNHLFTNPNNGLLLGKRHNQFEADQRLCRERMNKTIAAEESP